MKEKDGFMGFEGLYNHTEGRPNDDASLPDEEIEKRRLERATPWKQNIHGPFTQAIMPAGAGFVGKEKTCFELFELRTENLSIDFTERNTTARKVMSSSAENDGNSNQLAEASTEQIDDPDLLF